MCAQQAGGTVGNERAASSRQGVEGRPLKEGGIAGAVTFLVGYILTYILLFLDTEVFSNGLEGFGWEFVGLAFYNAQFVRADTGMAETRNVLASVARTPDILIQIRGAQPVPLGDGFLLFPVLLYSILIGLLLVVAGYIVAQQSLPDRSPLTDSMEAGMTVAVGYLPLSFIGSFVFEESSGQTTISPDVFASVFIAGILLPIVFGAIGGYLSGR